MGMRGWRTAVLALLRAQRRPTHPYRAMSHSPGPPACARRGAAAKLVLCMSGLGVAGCSMRSETAWSPGGRCEFVASHDEALGQIETLSVMLHQGGRAPRRVWREVGDAPGRPIAWRGPADVDFETVVGGQPVRRRLHVDACASRG